MRKWKSQMALLLSGTIAITSIAPAGGITSLAAEKSAKVSQSGIWKGVAPSRTRKASPSGAEKASPSDGEKASPSEIQKKERFDAETSVAYLSDMELEDEHIGWGGKWFRDCNVGVDTGLDGGPITIILPDQGGVRSFKKGLAANAKSDAIIDVSKYQEQVFFALVGVDYTKPTGSCTFEVLTSADGSTWTSQWKSTGIRTGKDEAERVLFTIPKDAVKLKLVIGDGGNGNKNDNGVWASASILSSREGCSSMVEAEVSAPSYLKVNEAAPIAIAAYGLDGKKIDSGSLTVTAESDNEDTLITEEDNGGWKVTGVSDGTATVTVTIEKDGVTEEETFQIIVGKGDENTWRVESPDGSQTLLFFMNEEQGVDFVAITDGEETVGKSSTGIKTSVGDFTSGLTYDDISVKRINDSYNLIGAKTSYVENEAEEMTLSFIKEDAEYEIIARAYDDGFALCYSIPSAGEADEVKISEENTSFQLPKNSTSYAMDYTSYHERAPQKKNNSQLTGTYAMPLLYETNSGTWGLISEAGLSGFYCGGSLAGRGDGLVDVEFAPEQKKAVEAAVPFQSPWRFAVIGDPETISDNTMPENLSPECAIEDTSWIKPGVTGWTWLNKDKTDDFETYKRYVDMAAEMGWEYVLMDEHWQPIKRGGSNDKKDNWITDEDGYHRKFPDWLDELVSYADEKGVGLLAWAWNQDFDTEEEAKILEVWAKKGIKGIKIDFFNSQDQDTIKKYDMLMEKTAECHLLLNPHGSNKPTGERRTWPQALTREGILGAEQHRQGGKGSLTAEYNCLIPFTRGAVGPSDYTPLMSYQLVDENVFTVSQMAAHSIVFESGIPCLADKPEVYLNSPAKSLLTHLPASWDESHLLAGEPGDYVNMARRSGDDWYIGIICNKKQDAEVDLSFLEDGTYYASVYKDGETKEDIAVEMRTVTSEDVLIIPLAEKGGASIKITKEAPAQPEKITLSKEEITIVKNATAVITATVEPEGTEMDAVTWTSSDETVATVNHGIIKGVNSGTAVITASTGFDGSVSAACTVTVIDGRYELDRDTWAIQNENPDNWILNSGTSLTITSESGEYGNSVSNAKNVFFTDVTGDFSVSTKLSFEPEADYQSAGIILYADNKNVFEALRRYHHSFGNRCFDAVNIVNGKLSEKSASDDYQGEAIYLKVNRAGNTCTAYYSVDNENWTKLGDTVTNEGLSGADLKIGLYCVNGNNKGGAVPATFEDVTLEKDGVSAVIPFAEEKTENSITYVSDLELEDPYAQWGEWVKDRNVNVSSSEKGGPITLKLPGGEVRSFEKGVAANAKAHAVIDVSQYQGQMFFALTGVDYSKEDGLESKSGTCTFEVQTSTDGNTWSSQWISDGTRRAYNEAERVLFTIPEDATKLKLIVGDGGDGNGSDNGVWANASILSSIEDCSAMVAAEISGPTYLRNDESGVITVTAYGLDGNKIDYSQLIIKAESSNEAVVKVNEESGVWNVKAVADGTAAITVRAEKAGVVKERTLQMVVGEGDENTWKVESPDGSQTLLFIMNEKQGVDYVAIKDGESVVNTSATGIKTSVGDFTYGLIFKGMNTEKRNDAYDLIGAKTAHVENEYTESTLSFTKEAVEFEVIARIYNNGFALRYRIPTAGDTAEVKISEECTSFALPDGSTSYAMKYTPWHEEAPDKKSNSELNSEYAMPLLYETKAGTWGLISEAAVNGSYCGGMLKGQGNGTVDVKFAPEQKSAVSAKLPFESPWRFNVIGDATDINENTMAENLSPVCQVEETSWIKPGVTGWTWLNKDPCDNPEVYKKYIDMAAEMGWSYILMDDGWQKNQSWHEENDSNGKIRYLGFPDWLDELVAYGEERGVGLLAWARNSDFDTPEELRGLELWKEHGIRGIKIDFFNSQDQATMKKYDALMEKTAECHLLLNPHGANKTTGERRTWPQTLTREGILGAEQHRQGGWASLNAEYTCLIPFTRNAVGPADFTPLMSYYDWQNNNAFKNTFTVSQMAAHSIVFESGIQCLADKPAVYLNSPAKTLLKNLPASWDESQMLEGEPGNYVNIARRSGEDWYVGIICNKKQDAVVDLSFLGDGVYYASVYKDGKTKTDIDVEMHEVTSEDVLTIPLAEQGGASIKITKEAPVQPESITLSEKEITIEERGMVVITATVEPEGTDWNSVSWKSSNENVATVENGTIRGLTQGTAVITAATGFDGSISAECKVTVIPPRYQLDRDVWTVSNENQDNWKLNSETSLTITSESGEYGTGVSNAKNVFFTNVEGDFNVSAKISFEPEADYQSAGIILYADNKNVFEALRRYHHSFGNRCFAAVSMADGKLSEKTKKDDYQGKPAYLKISRTGNTFTAYLSGDNENWTQIGEPISNNGLTGTNLQVGLYCVNGEGKGGVIPAIFEDVTLEKEGIAEVIPFVNAEDEEWEQLKDDLRELIQLGKAYEAEEEIYTEDSFGIFKKAINAAKEALEKEEAKEILAGCYETLEAAIKGLVKKEDTEDKELEKIKAELAELINSCAGYEEDVYTESSYAELTKAKKAAEDALVQEETKDILLSCHKALKAAIEGLVEKEDTEDKELEKIKSELKELIDSCMKYEENAYTESSFAVLKAALVSAKKALADDTSGKERLVDCYNNLLTASKNLEKVKNESSNGGSSSGSSYTSASVSGPKWVQDAMGWWLRNKDGSYPKEQWASMTENGKIVWYYFDADGYMKDGWLNVNEKTYFLHNIADGTRGAMYTGWHTIEGKWYYFEEKEGADQGMLLTDCVTPDGYRVNANGVWVR